MPAPKKDNRRSIPNSKNNQTIKDQFRNVFKSLGAPEGGLPRLSTAVSHLTSDKLGDMIAKYSAWREFCEDSHLAAVAEYMEAKEKYDMALSKQMVLADAPDVTTKKALAMNDKEVTRLRGEFTNKEVYKEMIAHKLESFSNSLSMLSRELTRRGIINV